MKHWKRLLTATAIITSTTVAAGGIGAGGVDAAENCTTRSTKQAFSQWGDSNQYFTVTNGTFESGTGGWTLTSGVTTKNDQATWKVNGASHSKALSIPGGGSAEAPFMCVNSDEDSMRFFYRNPTGNGSANLQVKIEVKSDLGQAVNTWTVGTSSTGWNVSPRIMLPNLRDANGQQWIRLSFTSINTPAAWVVDDVMIDPWVSR